MTDKAGGSGAYDFLLAGGGLAGLSLAYHMLHAGLAERRILILDHEAKRKNDRTWCYWSIAPGPFDFLAFRRWDRMTIAHPRETLRLNLAPYRYRMIRGIDFYRTVQSELSRNGNVHFRVGEVRAIREEPDEVFLETDEDVYRGKWAFNSLFRPGEFTTEPQRFLYMKQHFLGWEIETDRNVFAPDSPSMFDFRTPQSCGLRFMYILPFSEKRALVEYTLFSESLLSEDAYVTALRTYLRDVLHLASYRVLDTERGEIPMTNHRFPRRLGKRVLAIGTRGGRVKASTGYAFRRIQTDSEAIVRSLLRYGDPFHLPADSRRYDWLDTVFLRLLKMCPDDADDIFHRMFRRNPVGRVLRFLDEEGTAWENLRLMATMHKLLFLRAAFGLG